MLRNRSDRLRGQAHPALKRLMMITGVLILVGCRTTVPTPITSPLTTSPATSTAPSPQPTITDTRSDLPSEAPSKPSVTAKPVDTPTRPPSALSYEEALRPAFRSDADQFPSATRYRIDLTLDPERATLSGSQHTSYTNTETVALDALYLRLFPSTPSYGGRMSVNTLQVNGQQVEPVTELQGSALRVPLDPPLAPGAHVGLRLNFTLALPTEGDPADSRESSEGYRQLGIYDDVTALANAYPIIPVYDDGGWNVELAPAYGDAVFSDVALFDVNITVSDPAPGRMTLAASGTCTLTDRDDAKTTWSCVAAPVRDFNIVLGEKYRVATRDIQGIAVNSIFYAGHEEGGAAVLDYAGRAARLFDSRIGPYPFAELDVVESPTLAGGIEYPGLVVINQSYYASDQGISDRMEWVVVHEVLHQWWYGLVGNDQVDEPWLDESLVQYCTLLYFEDQYGQNVAERLLDSVFQETYQELRDSGRDQPVGLPVAEYSGPDYGRVVYRKGPLYFHNLRQQVGEETFWRVLETYFERNRYRVAQPEDWLAAVEAVTGSEHRTLYDKWIQGTEG